MEKTPGNVCVANKSLEKLSNEGVTEDKTVLNVSEEAVKVVSTESKTSDTVCTEKILDKENDIKVLDETGNTEQNLSPEEVLEKESDLNDTKGTGEIVSSELKKPELSSEVLEKECESKDTKQDTKETGKTVSSELKTPEKSSSEKILVNENNLNVPNEIKKTTSELKTPEKLSSAEVIDKKIESKDTKETEETVSQLKTPEKSSEDISEKKSELNVPNERKRTASSELKTPEKENNSKKIKETAVTEFRTPEKSSKNFNENKENKRTPEKQSDQIISLDGEDGMISTTEQARLLIAASKTPSKSVNLTPVKQNTPTGKRSFDGSPGTPGKYRRVELITLASPKAKRMKQME